MSHFAGRRSSSFALSFLQDSQLNTSYFFWLELLPLKTCCLKIAWVYHLFLLLPTVTRFLGSHPLTVDEIKLIIQQLQPTTCSVFSFTCKAVNTLSHLVKAMFVIQLSFKIYTYIFMKWIHFLIKFRLILFYASESPGEDLIDWLIDWFKVHITVLPF